jgi:outer membrane protein assembly factor BamE
MRFTAIKSFRTTLGRRTLAAPALAALVAAFLAGCVYRIPVQQGNLLDPSQVAQLEQGMTRTQVSFLLGTPMVPPSFDDSRWEYYYYVRPKPSKAALTRRLTVYFEDDKVARFDKENIPDSAPANTANAVNRGGERLEAPK